MAGLKVEYKCIIHYNSLNQSENNFDAKHLIYIFYYCQVRSFSDYSIWIVYFFLDIETSYKVLACIFYFIF